MIVLAITLAILALVEGGWLVTLYWQREQGREALRKARLREEALSGGNQSLQKRLEAAEDTVRHYRETAKVANIHNAWLEAKKEEA